MHLMSSAIQVN